ncbi:MAG TPA: hypothetical protein VNT26_08875, partial [Candidatus Sulfotelmatobacter sp.]|nr:hypothetical protein [Candidatus Sulfotelmatobacter sp.]
MSAVLPSTVAFARAPFLGCALWALLGTPVLANTYVIPHLLEKSGAIAKTPFTVDTTLLCTYNGSLNGKDTGSARVEFYLYDEQTGQLMQGLSNTICGPCGYQLDAQHRQLALPLEELILSQGGGFDSEVKSGFGVVVVSGSHSNAVNLQVVSYNSHSNAADVSVFGFEPQPLAAAARSGAPPERRTWVIPHILETKGSTALVSNVFDTTLYATYSGGLPGGSAGMGASLELYLYDQATGEPMLGSAGTAVCNPCTFNLGTGGAGTAPRKRTIVLDDLITAAGGFDSAKTREGFALMTVGGEDPAGVNLQGFVVNAHTGPFDLSVYAFDPQPVKTNSGNATARSFVLPHVLEK